jgi:glutaredoxin 3
MANPAWLSLLLMDFPGGIGKLSPLRMQADNSNRIRLFIKPYCGWCHEAMDWLDKRGIKYEKLDVIGNAEARKEMIELSGQTLAPVIEVDGEILADFDTDQLEHFWAKFSK